VSRPWTRPFPSSTAALLSTYGRARRVAPAAHAPASADHVPPRGSQFPLPPAAARRRPSQARPPHFCPATAVHVARWQRTKPASNWNQTSDFRRTLLWYPTAAVRRASPIAKNHAGGAVLHAPRRQGCHMRRLPRAGLDASPVQHRRSQFPIYPESLIPSFDSCSFVPGKIGPILPLVLLFWVADLYGSLS
jgi:hypothetical protein